MIRLYDPHPGMAGCPSPLPEPVRLAAVKLAGKVTTLEQAITQIEAASQGMRREVTASNGCIRLVVRTSVEDYPVNCWRVLRYEEVGDAPPGPVSPPIPNRPPPVA